MSKLPLVTAVELSRLLGRLGFRLERQRGSHAYFKHADGRATVVPFHKGEIVRRGLLRVILNDIGLSPAEYLKLRAK